MGTGAYNRHKDTDHVMLHVHIPKTGGSTLQKYLEDQIKHECDIVNNEELMERIEWFSNTPLEKQKRVQLIGGHEGYGIHHHIPQDHYTYITVMRNPIDRVISYYYYFRGVYGHPLQEKFHEISLEEFVSSDEYAYGNSIYCDTTNEQVRYINGNGEYNLERAKDILKNEFHVVGLTEDMKNTIRLVAHEMNWDTTTFKSVNVTRKRPKYQEIPEHIKSIVAERNAKDMELYEFGSQLFYEKLKSHE